MKSMVIILCLALMPGLATATVIDWNQANQIIDQVIEEAVPRVEEKLQDQEPRIDELYPDVEKQDLPDWLPDSDSYLGLHGYDDADTT